MRACSTFSMWHSPSSSFCSSCSSHRISHTNVVDICHNEQHRGVMNGKKHNRRCLHCRFALGFFQKENHVAVQILSPSFPFEFSKPFQILDILYLFLSSLMFFFMRLSWSSASASCSILSNSESPKFGEKNIPIQ